MTKLLIKYLPLVLFVMITISSCKDKKDGKAEKKEVVTQEADNANVNTLSTITFTDDQYKLSDIQLGTIESRNLSNVIKMTGVVDAEPGSIASISAPLGGYIKTSGLLTGQQVKKGQLLAILENPEFISIQQQYLESIGRIEYLEAEYKRQRDLRAEDINAVKTFEQVSSDLKVMKAKILGMEQQMALIGISSASLRKSNKISRTANIYAPISGYIKASNVNIGKYVASTDVLFEITGTNDLHLALNAFEKDLARIHQGQLVKFSLSNENRYNRTAKVYLVGQTADENKIIAVHCHVADRQGLLPGMFVKALLETGAEQQIAVPTDALVQLETSDYIIVQLNQGKGSHTFQLIRVLKGIEQAGYTAIELPSTVNAKQLAVVVKNAYAILSAIKNAEEE